MASQLLREVLQDIVAMQRWGANAPPEVTVETITKTDAVRRISVINIRKAAEKGVRCQFLGGDKRASRCSLEPECSGVTCRAASLLDES